MSVVEAKIKKYLQVVGFPYFRLIEFGFSDRKSSDQWSHINLWKGVTVLKTIF